MMSVTRTNSECDPTLTPMISRCLKNSRGRVSGTSPPEVPPQLTYRPPFRIARIDDSQVAAPTLSITMSAFTGNGPAESKASTAPISSARRRFALSREVT